MKYGLDTEILTDGYKNARDAEYYVDMDRVIDATPDGSFAVRILQAYREDCNAMWSDGTTGKPSNPLLVELNNVQRERAAELDWAIALLANWQRRVEQLGDASMIEKTLNTSGNVWFGPVPAYTVHVRQGEPSGIIHEATKGPAETDMMPCGLCAISEPHVHPRCPCCGCNHGWLVQYG